MILFNLKKLEQKLIDNTLSDGESFFYLIANWLLFGAISFAIAIDQYGNPGVVVFLLIIPIPGSFIVYRTNRQWDNKNFLQRFIPLHFVAGLRITLFFAIWIMFLDLLDNYLLDNLIGDDIYSGLVFAALIGFYFSMISSIKKISKPKE